MSFKTATVLRSAVPLKTLDGVALKPGARVVVMSTARVTEKNGSEKIKVKVVDPTLPDLIGHRVIASPGAFKITKAGRPKLEK